MKSAKNGFVHLVLVVLIVVFVVVGFAASWAYTQKNDKQGIKPVITNVFLDGGTDDEFDNFYTIGFVFEDLMTDTCGDTDIKIKVKKISSDADNLRLNVLADIPSTPEKSDEEGVSMREATCTALPTTIQASYDLDSSWLASGGKKSIVINDKDHSLEIDISKRILKIDDSKPVPFYPNKIAVLSMDRCQKNRETLRDEAKRFNLTPADEIFAGLSDLYRNEYTLHIKYDTNAKNYEAKKLANEEENKIGRIDNLDIDCGYRISKPNLKAL